MTERRYDPNPTVDGNDPDAYRRYAERLDREVPDWYLDDAAGMAAPLAVYALQRRLLRTKVQPLTPLPPLEVPFLTPLQQNAVATYELFNSYVQAGFRRDEALALLLDILRDAREQNRRDNGGSS